MDIIFNLVDKSNLLLTINTLLFNFLRKEGYQSNDD